MVADIEELEKLDASEIHARRLNAKERITFEVKTTKCSSKHREIVSISNKIQKPRHACIVQAHDSTRERLERTLAKDHEDHIPEKGFNLVSHCNLCTSLLLCTKR